ncbi:TIR domain-containing protein [Methylobacterium sp. B1]|uniref:TIR domain-containing protein n=1 Tax=Methylobacterium sp. B1 TaxID=91459 RepID=UPI00034BEBC5|nr:TIR domain-containing protein [Methylobacterium sp. B1]
MKVFLSHSSKDKAIVSEVANRLGRAFVTFDAYNFEFGEDISKSIRDGMDQADSFVFFVSKESLGSEWVRVEIDAAANRKIRESSYKVHTIVIDSGISTNDIPKWMRNNLYFKSRSPSQIYREIHRFVFKNVADRQTSLFVGRREEIQKIEDIIAPASGSREPSTFCLYGQNGIGRRSIIRQISGNLLGLPKQIEIALGEGSSLNEIAFLFHENLYPSKSDELLSGKLEKFSAMSKIEIQASLDEVIQSISSARELIVFNDEGGFLDNDGFVQSQVLEIIERIENINGARAVIISRRRPSNNLGVDAIPSIRIGPLSNDDTSRLLRRNLSQININLSDSDIRDLVAYIHGYAPAVNFVAEVSRRGEIQRLIHSKSQLVDFTTAFMLREIEKSGDKFTSTQKIILYILALYSPLPLSVLANTIKFDAEAINSELSLLFDLAFVLPQDKLLKISDPLQNAAVRLFGQEWNDHADLSDAIYDYVQSLEDNQERIALGRALFRANSLSGNMNDKRGIALTSDFINVAKELYHNRRYDESISFGRLALEQRADNVDVMSYLARAYIQVENYNSADILIKRLKDIGFLRDHYFIEGFKQRRIGNFDGAASAYERAVKEGRRGAAVHRELAHCYIELGQIDKAKSSISKAHENDADNKYVVDLEILIALKAADRPLAERRLMTLAAVDSLEFYLHRKSTFHYRFREYQDAYEFASAAYKEASSPNFAITSQLIKASIAESKFEEARIRLAELERFRDGRYFDIKIGLKCKLESSEGDYAAALGTWQRLRDRNKPVHLALKLAALQVKMTSVGLDVVEKDEVQRLENLLNRFEKEDLDAFFGGDSRLMT